MDARKENRLIRRLDIANTLSFGNAFAGIELRNLNVLIGPNASGKSNLIEVINFLRAAPRDFQEALRNGVGATNWQWKTDGYVMGPSQVVAEFDHSDSLLTHLVAGDGNLSYAFNTEKITCTSEKLSDQGFSLEYVNQPGQVPFVKKNEVTKDLEYVRECYSILATIRDPENYPELAWLADRYDSCRIYREWMFGRRALYRTPQRADARNDRLEEDLSNLALVLNRIRIRHPQSKQRILEGLRELYDGIIDYDVLTEGGTVQLFFTEEKCGSIPASSLSDGTLRYLSLLTILCDPSPPGLICIEEPELGLHPDVIPALGDLLREAATRSQIIVTTHSDVLVDAMSETPESVVVCSKENGQSVMQRLDTADLHIWLEKYRLGQLWTEGKIGGNRW